MEEFDDDDYSPEAVVAGAKRNRASWRRDCEEICRAGRCLEEVWGLAQKMLRLLDETEGMYHGQPPKLKTLSVLIDTICELQNKTM